MQSVAQGVGEGDDADENLCQHHPFRLSSLPPLLHVQPARLSSSCAALDQSIASSQLCPERTDTVTSN